MVMRAEFDSTINQESLGQSTVKSHRSGTVTLKALPTFELLLVAIALVVVREIELPGAVRNSASAGLSMRRSRIICSQSYTERRLKRKISSSSDRRDLSFVLRVLGDYLDRKTPGQFTISWSQNSIMISYDQIREIFTPENLYDFGIHMYLRRSTRDRAT